MATTEEIIAMKIDVVQRIGRKKDFWDLHELLSHDNISTIILNNLSNFELADDDFDPICLRGKYWEFIKEDIVDAVKTYKP